MNTLKRMVIVGLAVALPICSYGETATVKVPPANTSKPTADKNSSNPPVNTSKITADRASYKPPLRGAPAGRVGGGTRGVSERESFSLLVLAPDHVGYTTRDQPCLYWFISKPTSYSIELTINERKAVKPLIEKIIKTPDKAGIQAVCLADYGIKLVKNVQYKWFVTLVTDVEHRSKDILAGGMLELIDSPPALAGKLKAAGIGNASSVYAEEGVWYDALESLSKLADVSPDEADIRLQRATLLGQVGLAEVADFENRQQHPGQ